MTQLVSQESPPEVTMMVSKIFSLCSYCILFQDGIMLFTFQLSYAGLPLLTNPSLKYLPYHLSIHSPEEEIWE